MTQTISSTIATLAQELNIALAQVQAAVKLLDEGATVPFIARYRKEVTSGLNDVQLRLLAERLYYLRELDERRAVVLQSILEQGKLTPDLEQAILSAKTKTRLEDLYLPYRPKRRTKAHLAKEAGLEPLALALLDNPTLIPEEYAQSFMHAEGGVGTIADALEGARQILMEKFAEDPDLLEEMRQYLWNHVLLCSTATKVKSKKEQEQKFADYFDYRETIKTIPSHRASALFRGRRENALQLTLILPDEIYGEQKVISYFKIVLSDAARSDAASRDTWLMETVRLAWKIKIFPKLELEALARLRELADEESVRVFANNLRDLLLAPPAGAHVTMGLDPGIRTGVKVAVINETGKLLDYATVFPLAPHNEWHEAMATLAKLAVKHHVSLISIGNGTGSRETVRLVNELIKMYPDLKLTKVMVSEAGASVYSASELAANELPDLDVTLRGAVSIARRLQDPLAELVKIEPKSIGVGQYQHDVNQSRLGRSLSAIVEDCVNAVGVDVNQASVALLTYVSGLNESLAKNLVQYRDQHGAFRSREQLKLVPRMGERAFQQSAGFLRIIHGEHPLDASGVHPEAYPLVDKILFEEKLTLEQLIGHVDRLKSVNASCYVDDNYGLPTITDVLRELEKPGRDPRPEFRAVNFKDGIEDIRDLSQGMILEGVVSNVTNFGAFVDIGVHQDGLVHISEMTHRFINDPRTKVKAGDVVTVKVLDVDLERRRIGLTMKLAEQKQVGIEAKVARGGKSGHDSLIKVQKTPGDAKLNRDRFRADISKKSKVGPNATKKPSLKPKANVFNTAMADALMKLKRDSQGEN